MKTLIKIEKEDVLVSRIGVNVEIHIDPKISLVFTIDALDELISDYSEIKKEIQDIEKKQVKTNQLEINFPE